MLVARERMKSLILFSLTCLGLVLSQTRQPDIVPFTTDCKLTKGGHEYAGPLSLTRSGRTCQRWNSTQPHSQPYKDSTLYPEGSASAAGNRCRNPDSNYNDGVWCYTTSPSSRWEQCNVAFCECKLSSDMLGVRYQGQTRTTRSGKQCQAWSSQWPNRHPYFRNSFFPDASLAEASNYCRNPNASRPEGPWCYTTVASVVWEYCRIPVCNITSPVFSTRAQTSTQTSPTQTPSSSQRSTSPSTTVPRTIPLSTTISSRSTRPESLTTFTMSSKTIPPSTTSLPSTSSTTSLRTTPAITTRPETLATSTRSSITIPLRTTSLPSTTSLRTTPPRTVSSSTMSSKVMPPSTTSSPSSTRLTNTPPITTSTRPMPSTTMSSATTASSTTSPPSTTSPQSTTSQETMYSTTSGPETVSSSTMNQRTASGSATRLQSPTNVIIRADGSTVQGTQQPADSSGLRENKSIGIIQIVIPIIVGVIAVVSIIVVIFLWKRTKLFQTCCKGNGDLHNAPNDKKSQETALAAANVTPNNNDFNGFQNTDYMKHRESAETPDMTKDPTDGIIVKDSGATYIPMNNIKPS